MDTYEAECKRFKDELREFLVKRNPSEYVGEIISFPVADSSAEYMVAALKPIQLVHIPLWDAWHYEYAHRLTAKDIKEKIDSKKAFDKAWSDTKNQKQKKEF